MSETLKLIIAFVAGLISLAAINRKKEPECPV
jgi:hypothetical protein